MCGTGPSWTWLHGESGDRFFEFFFSPLQSPGLFDMIKISIIKCLITFHQSDSICITCSVKHVVLLFNATRLFRFCWSRPPFSWSCNPSHGLVGCSKRCGATGPGRPEPWPSIGAVMLPCHLWLTASCRNLWKNMWHRKKRIWKPWKVGTEDIYGSN